MEQRRCQKMQTSHQPFLIRLRSDEHLSEWRGYFLRLAVCCTCAYTTLFTNMSSATSAMTSIKAYSSPMLDQEIHTALSATLKFVPQKNGFELSLRNQSHTRIRILTW